MPRVKLGYVDRESNYHSWAVGRSILSSYVRSASSFISWNLDIAVWVPLKALKRPVSSFLVTHKLLTNYHPPNNEISERWHRGLKVTLMARLQSETSWVDKVPTTLLGLRAAIRSDNGVSATEITYGRTIRLPGDFYEDSIINCSKL